MDKDTSTYITWLVIFTFMFVVGLWIIDINFSLVNFESAGFEGRIGTFVFEDFDSRTHYHLGIILTILGFFGINANHLRYQTRKGEPSRHSKVVSEV